MDLDEICETLIDHALKGRMLLYYQELKNDIIENCIVVEYEYGPGWKTALLWNTDKWSFDKEAQMTPNHDGKIGVLKRVVTASEAIALVRAAKDKGIWMETL